VNPGSSLLTRRGSLCVGHLNDPGERWWEPGTPAPDGAYALCRADGRRLELVTDLYASRSLWYVLTDDAFFASSSQRALVALLGGFELNPEAVSWLLSSGYLPPRTGWDARIRLVPPASRVSLDCEHWTLETTRHLIPITPAPVSEDEAVARLLDATMDSCARLDVSWPEWRLALSGGMDSRSILLGLLNAHRKPACITWGLAAARRDPKNDAVVGERLAAYYGLPHTFYPTDPTDEPLESVLGRYVATCEGRLDHFDAYTDGLRMWKRLFESGVAGVIRGDAPSSGYRWYHHSELQARQRSGAHMIEDYPPSHAIHRLGLAPQTWPEELRRRPEESVAAYSGRLYGEFAAPALLSPLNDMKGLYLEVANPLLSRSVVAALHGAPATLRVGRRALKVMLEAINPEIPFAEHVAPADRLVYLGDAGFRRELRRVLASADAERVFSEEAVTSIAAGLAEEAPTPLWPRVRARIKAAAPERLSQRLKPYPLVSISGSRLAFRAYIAIRAAAMLSDDAGALGRGGVHAHVPSRIL
jgi:asparagine synthetase B (glutamine-hydrolysing)